MGFYRPETAFFVITCHRPGDVLEILNSSFAFNDPIEVGAPSMRGRDEIVRILLSRISHTFDDADISEVRCTIRSRFSF